MLNEIVETLWQVDFGEGATVQVVMVNVDHTILRVHLHSFREQIHKLNQSLLRAWCCRIVYKDDTLSILLDRPIALLILQIAADVPEFNIDFTKVGHRCGRLALKIDNPKRSIPRELHSSETLS